MAENTQTTLRDTISAAFDAAETQPDAPEPSATPAPAQVAEPSKEDSGAQAAAEQEKTDRRKLREHGPDGKFLPKGSAPQAPAIAGTGTPPPTPAVAEPARPPRPSSWAKDYWEHWDKLDPKLAAYLAQREGEYAKGVSTYKQEWDRAKPFLDAVAPYQQELQRYGINPAEQFGRYVEIHRGLALGTPQQKLGMLARIATDYKIPLQGLLVQGQDGKVYFNQQLLQQQQQAPQMRAPQVPDVARIVDERLSEVMATQQTQAFIQAKDAAGNPAHPHFETVKDTMAQLLESGLADDLESAYQKALKLNDELWQQVQQQNREAEEKSRQEKLKADAERARRQNVQVRTQTPAAAVASSGKKGLRATLEEATDQVLGGRV